MIECKFKIYNIDYNEEPVVFRLIPIIKDIDNSDNILNKFKLGIVTTKVESITNKNK